MWIKTKTSYAGQEGSFPAGNIIEVTAAKLKAIDADVEDNGLPKFKRTKTRAPWDKQKRSGASRPMGTTSRRQKKGK